MPVLAGRLVNNSVSFFRWPQFLTKQALSVAWECFLKNWAAYSHRWMTSQTSSRNASLLSCKYSRAYFLGSEFCNRPMNHNWILCASQSATACSVSNSKISFVRCILAKISPNDYLFHCVIAENFVCSAVTIRILGFKFSLRRSQRLWMALFSLLSV